MPDRRLRPEEFRSGLRRALYAALIVVAILLGPVLIRSCVARFVGG